MSIARLRSASRRSRRTTVAGTFVASVLVGLVHTGLLVLAFPPAEAWLLICFVLVPLILLAERTTRPWLSAIGVLLGGWVVWLWPHAWLIDVTALGYPLLAGYQALYAPIFVLIWHLLRRRSVQATSPLRRIPTTLLAPVIWVGLEYFRGSIFGGGYAWYLLGHPAINAVVLCQIADLVGAYGVSFVMAMCSGLIADLLTRPLLQGTSVSSSARTSFALFALTFVLTLGYGLVRLAGTPSVSDNAQTPEAMPDAASVMTIAAVQTNLPQSNKLGWGVDEQIRDFAEFIRLTRRGVEPTLMAGEGEDGGVAGDFRAPDLICWPETMVPGAGLNPEAQTVIRETEARERMSTLLRPNTPGTIFHTSLLQLSDLISTPILVGSLASPRLDIAIERFRNEAGELMVRIEHDIADRRNSTFLYLPDPVPAIEAVVEPPLPNAEEDAVAVRGGEIDAVQVRGRYDKIVLTPFGEVIPFLHRWPALQQRALDLGAQGMSFDLSPGLDAVRFDVPRRAYWEATGRTDSGEIGAAETFSVATPICFESTVSRRCRRLVWSGGNGKAADVLVNVTNDGWFGNSVAGREQHLQIGRFRAIENRVPMVRAANTGISAAIDSAGRIVVWGPNVPTEPGDVVPPSALAQGVLIATLPVDPRATVFGVIGDALGLVCLIVAGGLLMIGPFLPRGRSGPEQQAASPTVAAPSTAADA